MDQIVSYLIRGGVPSSPAEQFHRQLKTLTDYSNPNDTYSPSSLAKYAAMLTPNEELTLSEAYLKKVIITVASVLLAGIIAFLLFNCGVLLRCCCRCMRCLPRRPAPNRHSTRRQRSQQPSAAPAHELVSSNDPDGGHIEMQAVRPAAPASAPSQAPGRTRRPKRYPWTCGRYFLYALLAAASLVALATDQFFLVGRESFTKGLDRGMGVVDGVQTLFDSALNETDVLVDYAGDLTTEYDAAETTCPLLTLSSTISSSTQAAIDDFESAMGQIDDLLTPLSDRLDSYQSKAQTYYADGAAFFVIWALVVVTLGISWLFVATEKRRELMSFALCFGNATYLVLVLLQPLLMFLATLLGDLCGDDARSPTETVLTLVPFSGDVLATAQYYATCVASNASSVTTVSDYIAEGYGYTAQLTGAVQSGLTYCPSDAHLTAMLTTLTAMNATLATLTDTVACAPIQQLWFGLVNDAVCTHMFSGVFYVWGACLLTSIFLFGALVLSSLVYQYWLPLAQMLPPKQATGFARAGSAGRDADVDADNEFLRMYSGNFSDDEDDDDGDGDEDAVAVDVAAMTDEQRLAALNNAARNYEALQDQRRTQRQVELSV